MEKYLFLFKENNTDDRDCVKYVEANLFSFDCGHYFSGINLNGACFSQSFKLKEIDFENITTILKKSDFEKLDILQKRVNALGCGIKKDSEKYKEGLEIQQKANIIIRKLQSKENQELFEKVIEEEKEFLFDNEDLTEEEIEEIFENYNLDYQDRGIFGNLYNDCENLGEEEAESYIELNEQVKRYFDFESFGGDLVDGENYIELESGRIASLNY